MASRRITQATFDEAVEENIREFGMSREEAVADAVSQFEASGVDLTGIVRDGSDPSENPIIAAVKCLKAWAVDKTVDDADAVKAACAKLFSECGKSAVNKSIARSNGGVTFVSAAVVAAAASGEAALRKCTLDALRALCANNDDCRNEVDPKEVAPVVLAGCRADSPVEVRRSALLCAAVLCVKKEGMKTALFEGGLPDIVTEVLKDAAGQARAAAAASSTTAEQPAPAPALLKEACIALARLLTDDDMSVLASNAYAYARQVASSGVVAESLLAVLKGYNTDDVTSAEVYSALRSVTVNDDVCRQVDSAGGIALITTALAAHTSSPIRVSAASLGLAGGASSSIGAGAVAMMAGGLGSIPEAEETDPTGRPGSTTGTATGAADGQDETGSMGGGASVAESGSLAGDPAELISDAGSVGSAGGAAGVVAAALEAAATAAAAGTETATQRRIRVVRCGLSVLRTLANSDPNKARMGEGPTLGLLLQVLETAADVPPILEQAVAAIGNLCLRLPDNARRVYDRGGLTLIAKAMRRHPGYGPLQRSSCLTLRNLIARAQDRIQAAFDEGFEQLLQNAYVRHPTCRDVSYACLRDMGCSYAETTIGRAQAERAARAIQANDIRVL